MAWHGMGTQQLAWFCICTHQGCRFPGGGRLEELVDLGLAVAVVDLPHDLAQPVGVLHPGAGVCHLSPIKKRRTDIEEKKMS